MAQLTALDHAASPESYPPAGFCSPSYALDMGFIGDTSLPLALTLAQMCRKPEALADSSQDTLLGNTPPALSGYGTAAAG